MTHVDPNLLICPEDEGPRYSGVDADGDGRVDIVEQNRSEENLSYSPATPSPVSIPPAPDTPQYAESRYDPESRKLKPVVRDVAMAVGARLFAPLAVAAAPLLATAQLAKDVRHATPRVEPSAKPLEGQASRGNNSNAARDEAKNFWFAARARAAWEGQPYNVEYASRAFANIVAAGGLSPEAQRLVQADLNHGGGRNMREMRRAFDRMAETGRRMMESPLGGIVRAVSETVVKPLKETVEQVARAVSRPVEHEPQAQPVRRVYALEDARDDEGRDDGVPPANPDPLPEGEAEVAEGNGNLGGAEGQPQENGIVAQGDQQVDPQEGPHHPVEEQGAQAQRADEPNDRNQDPATPLVANLVRSNNVPNNQENGNSRSAGAAGVSALGSDGGEHFVGIPVGNINQTDLGQVQAGFVVAHDDGNNQGTQGPVVNIEVPISEGPSGQGVVGAPRGTGEADYSSNVSYVAAPVTEEGEEHVSGRLVSEAAIPESSNRGVGIHTPSLGSPSAPLASHAHALDQAGQQGGATVAAAAASHGDAHRNNPVASERHVLGEARMQSGKLAGVFDKNGGGAGSQNGHENGRGSADIVQDILAANELDEAKEHIITDESDFEFNPTKSPIVHDVVV